MGCYVSVSSTITKTVAKKCDFFTLIHTLDTPNLNLNLFLVTFFLTHFSPFSNSTSFEFLVTADLKNYRFFSYSLSFVLHSLSFVLLLNIQNY